MKKKKKIKENKVQWNEKLRGSSSTILFTHVAENIEQKYNSRKLQLKSRLQCTFFKSFSPFTNNSLGDWYMYTHSNSTAAKAFRCA